VSELAAAEVVSLPMFPEMTATQVDTVAAAVSSAISQAAGVC
jgi:dTDP-4-amino-4,6-dideoxygalactose transaminase